MPSQFMRYSLLCFLFALSVSGFAQNYNSKRITRLFDKPVERSYYVKERYHNGRLYVEGMAVQKIYSKKNRIELKRGAWKWYYRGGQLKDSVFYNETGLPQGIALHYRKNGTIAEAIDYGTSTNFKVRERNWLVAIPRDYSRTSYYESPNVPRKTEHYLNKKKSGLWQRFDEQGQVIRSQQYVKGKKISTKN